MACCDTAGDEPATEPYAGRNRTRRRLVARLEFAIDQSNILLTQAMGVGKARFGPALWAAIGVTVRLKRSDTLPGVLLAGTGRLSGSETADRRSSLPWPAFSPIGSNAMLFVFDGALLDDSDLASRTGGNDADQPVCAELLVVNKAGRRLAPVSWESDAPLPRTGHNEALGLSVRADRCRASPSCW